MEYNEIYDLYDLLLEQLRDLYDGEQQQLQALMKLDGITDSYDLKEVIEFHYRETQKQVERLESIFEKLGEDPNGESCDGIKGLIKEAFKLAKRCKNPEVRDAGIVTSIQHINHYEMAGYGTALAYTKLLNRHDIGDLLLDNLREEKERDSELSRIAEKEINPDARWSIIVSKAGKGEVKT